MAGSEPLKPIEPPDSTKESRDSSKPISPPPGAAETPKADARPSVLPRHSNELTTPHGFVPPSSEVTPKPAPSTSPLFGNTSPLPDANLLPTLEADKVKPPSAAAKKADEKPKPKKWYEKYTLRGYTQIRDNETLWHAPGSAPAHHAGDRSVGDAQNMLIRRARIILQGDVSDRVSIYLQPDFTIQPPGSPDATHFPQIRDWYADVHFDLEKKHRFRIGQSKVPYGWENMQSSSNRLPLDRNDAFNSATRNERELGVFYYWTPVEAQRLYKFATDEGLKGSGNYGVIAWGFYNGQGGSLVEQNNNLHTIFRVNVPYQFDNGQIVEVGIQGFTGRYTVLSSPIRALGVGPSIRPAGTLETGNREGHLDQRLGWTAVLLPQPLGFQAEWTIGRGPTLNAAQNAIGVEFLHGGYAMAMFRHRHCWGVSTPFVRWQYFEGGYRTERNAPFARINEWEFGVEYQPAPAAEFTMSYLITDRTNTTAIDRLGTIPYQQFVGHVLRMQFQFNY